MKQVLTLTIILLLSLTKATAKDYKLTLNVIGPKGVKVENVKVAVYFGNTALLPDTIIGNKALFSNYLYSGVYNIEATAKNFETVYDTIMMNNDRIYHKTIRLERREYTLPALKVKGKVRAVVYKGDTIQFNPEAVNKLQGDMAREILMQMPGVEINGNSISIYGNKVENTYVDGKKIFGDQPTTALDHVEADNVVRIQAFEDKKEKEDEPQKRRGAWALNIITANKMVNSMDAKVLAAGGKTLGDKIPGQHNTRYAAGGAMNFFSEELHYSAKLMHNNENVASTSDLRFLQIEDVNPSYSKNSCAGVGFDRNWNKRKKGLKKINIGYQWTRKETDALTQSDTEYSPFDNMKWRTNNQTNKTLGTDSRHTISASASFALGAKAHINTSVSQQFADNNNTSAQHITDNSNLASVRGTTVNTSNATGDNTNAAISLFQTIGKLKYSLSANFTRGNDDKSRQHADSTSTQGTTMTVNELVDINGFDRNHNIALAASVGYSDFKKLQKCFLSYKYNNSRQHLSQTAWNTLTGEADNVNTYHYVALTQTHNPALQIETPIGRPFLSATLGMRHTIVDDDNRLATEKSSYRFNMPDISLNMSWSPKSSPMTSFSIAYNISGTTPDIIQLRYQLDDTNPYWLTIGNPMLRPQTTHLITTQNNISLNSHGGMVMVNATAEWYRNSIVSKETYYTADTYLPDIDYKARQGSTISSFENVNDGNRQNLFANIIMPLSALRSSASMVLTASRSSLPFYYNDQLDKSTTTAFGGNIVLGTSLIPRTRVNLTTVFNTSHTSNQKSDVTNRINTLNVIARAETDITRHLFLKAKYQYTMQHNRMSESTEEENILNIYFGVRFLKEKRAELSVTAYDLLNSFNSRMVYTEQNFTRTSMQTNYGRFVSLNFTYTFRKYKSRNSWSGGNIDW